MKEGAASPARREDNVVDSGTDLRERSSGRAEPAVDARLDAIWREQSRRVYALCLSLLHNPADAEDATQEAFVRFARELPELTGSPAAFLTVVARNVCIDELRRRRRREMLAHRSCSPGASDPETVAVARTSVRGLWAELTRRDRILVGSLFHGLSYDEIASGQGWTVEAVRSGLARARRRARASLGIASGVLFAGLLRRLRAAVERTHPLAALDPGGTATVAVAATFLLAFPSGGGASFASPHPAVASPAAVTAPPLTAGRVTNAAAAQRLVPLDTVAAGPARATATPAPLAPRASSPGQESVAFTSVEPSPNYADDHTVYASGASLSCPVASACPVLFRSTTGGRSWERLPASGFAGGRILAPAAGTATLFSVTDGAGTYPALQRSDDGGRSFSVAVPGALAAAVDPSSPPGDPEVVASVQGQLVRYDSRSGTTAPIGEPALATEQVSKVAFAGGTLLVGATGRSDLQGRATVLACDRTATACATALSLPAGSVVQLAVAPGTERVVAWTATSVFSSTDGGRSFSEMASTQAPYSVDWLSFVPAVSGATRVAIGLWAYTGTAISTRTLVAGGDGLAAASFGLAPTMPLNALAFLPDGTMVAALGAVDGDNQIGLRCSTDGGATWRHTCLGA